MINNYELGSEVKVKGYSGTFVIIAVNTYTSRSLYDEDYQCVSYLVEGQYTNGDIPVLEVEEDEIESVKNPLEVGTLVELKIKLTAKTKYGQINELLDMLNGINKLNANTCGAFTAEKEKVTDMLRTLTSKVGE